MSFKQLGNKGNGLIFSSLVALYFITPFLVPINIITYPYIQGPNIWFVFICGLASLLFGLRLLVIKQTKCSFYINEIDSLIIIIAVYIFTQSILSETKIHFSDDLKIVACLKQVFSIITLMAAMVIIYSACRKVEPNNENPQISEKLATLTITDNLSVLKKSAIIDKIARQLAVNLKQKDMRSFIKSEALKMFDGDYDILYRDIKDVSVSGKSFKAHLVNNNLNSVLSLAETEELANTMPLLNISVPVNIDKWDTESYSPLVAVVPADYDDKTAKKVKAYDGDGNVHWLDATTSPDVPVIAVGTNERSKISKNQVILSYPKIKREKQYVQMENRRQVAITFNDGEAGDDPGGEGDPINTGNNCARYDGNWEYLYGLTFPGTSLQDTYEDWVLGAPEIRLIAFKPNSSFTELAEFMNHPYEPQKRRDVNGRWEYYDWNWPLFMWYTGDYGNIVIYKMIEEDSGQIFELTVSGQVEIPFTGTKVNLSGKINIKNNDDVGPTVPVDFRDTRCTKIYGDPTFKFHIRHQ